jgi:hypothetical protein
MLIARGRTSSRSTSASDHSVPSQVTRCMCGSSTGRVSGVIAGSSIHAPANARVTAAYRRGSAGWPKGGGSGSRIELTNVRGRDSRPTASASERPA